MEIQFNKILFIYKSFKYFRNHIEIIMKLENMEMSGAGKMKD